MLTLKFVKKDSTDRHVETSTSCATVEATDCGDGGYIISAFKHPHHAECVEYRLSLDSGDSGCHTTCFVINEAGKTIDKYSAYKL